MKKIYLILAAASVVLAANSCQKENVSSDDASLSPMYVKFTAKAAETKTVFGTPDENSIPVLWEGGENMSVCVNEHANAEVPDKIFVQVPENSTASAVASWAYDFSQYYGKNTPYVPEDPYTFYAFYPGNQMRAFHNTSTGKAHGIKIESLPSEQTPRENSCDPKAMFLCSVSKEYGEWPNEVDMPDFNHMTAYGCLTLGTGIPEDETVTKVTITANEGQFLAGTAWYYYAGDDKGTWENYTGTTGLAPTETLVLNTSSRKNIWFGCRPTTDLSSLTFGVYTDKGYYKVIKNLENKNLVAGRVAKMTITGFESAIETIKYVWATTSCNIASNTSKTIAYYTSENSEGILTWDGYVTTQTFSDGIPALPWELSTTVCKGTTNQYYYIGDDVANKRLKIGSKDYGYSNPFILTTKLPNYKVKSITVWASSAATNLHKLTAKVGDTELINVTLQKTATAVGSTGYEYTGTVDTAISGDVEIKIETSGSPNTIYLYKIQMTLEAVPEN